jgi:heme/copper-type cytochrome/quinol oxidase subunit 2
VRALAPVAIVAILAVTFLIACLTHRRSENRRADFRALRDKNARLRALITAIDRETQAQLLAGNASHGYTADLINDFDRQEINP